MKYLIISLIVLLASTSNCSEKRKRTELSTKKAAAFLIGKKKDTTTWKLVQSFDPYDGGKTIVHDSLNPQFLVVEKSGQFKEYDQDNYSEGKWYVNRDKTKMAMVYDIQNGVEIPKENKEIFFRYEIREMTDSSLILAIQGRHGMVERTYTPYMVDSEASSDSTEVNAEEVKE